MKQKLHDDVKASSKLWKTDLSKMSYSLLNFIRLFEVFA